MLSKQVVFFIILLQVFCVTVWGNECLLNTALKNPALSSNPEFWEALSRLPQKNGKYSDADLDTLIKKYSDRTVKADDIRVDAISFKSSPALSVHKTAEKEISRLSPNLKEKVDEFLEIILKPDGIKEIRNNPGRWRLEKSVQHGHNAHTVRITGGYRILFDQTNEGVFIRQVNKGDIHGN